MKYTILCSLIVLIFSADSFGQKKKKEKSSTYKIRTELEKHFNQYGYTGSFLVYDLKNKKYTCYNPERCKQRFSPASTFKIFNSLVALETGVATDANFAIKWDSIQRGYSAWNQDHTLKSAFTYSAVWYFQELARRIGSRRMKYHIERENYGNKNISGGTDVFWLNSSLEISQEEQVAFLKKLYLNKLESFSPRTMSIVKDIMLSGDTSTYKLRSKTGSINHDSAGIYFGWYVGYLEKGDQVYIFALNMEAPIAEEANAFPRRKEITLAILKELKILE